MKNQCIFYAKSMFLRKLYVVGKELYEVYGSCNLFLFLTILLPDFTDESCVESAVFIVPLHVFASVQLKTVLIGCAP